MMTIVVVLVEEICVVSDRVLVAVGNGASWDREAGLVVASDGSNSDHSDGCDNGSNRYNYNDRGGRCNSE